MAWPTPTLLASHATGRSARKKCRPVRAVGAGRDGGLGSSQRQRCREGLNSATSGSTKRYCPAEVQPSAGDRARGCCRPPPVPKRGVQAGGGPFGLYAGESRPNRGGTFFFPGPARADPRHRRDLASGLDSHSRAFETWSLAPLAAAGGAKNSVLDPRGRPPAPKRPESRVPITV